MKSMSNGVILESGYSRAARITGVIIFLFLALVAGMIFLGGKGSVTFAIILAFVLLFFAKLAASTGGVRFTQDKIEMFRNILLHKHYVSFPTKEFSKLKIILKYTHTMGETGKPLYYLVLIKNEELDQSMPLVETTGTAKAKEIYINAKRVSAVTGLPLEIDELIKSDFPIGAIQSEGTSC